MKHLEELLVRNKPYIGHLPAIKPTIRIDITDSGSFFIDLKTNRVTEQSDADTDCTIRFASKEIFEESIADPGKAWTLANNGSIQASERFAALMLAESLFPGALKNSFTARQYKSLFPHLLPNEYSGMTTEEFFEKVVPRKLKDDPKLLSTVVAAYQFDIDGAGTWTIDMTGVPGQVYNGPAKAKGSIISTDRATFEEVLNDDSKAWLHFNSGRVTVTNACRASQVVNAIWPGAFAKGMPAPLYASLFPNALGEPSDSEYNRTTGKYTTYVKGKEDKVVPITYSQMGDLAIYEGDIILGTMEEMEHIKNSIEAASPDASMIPEGIQIIDWGNPTKYIWPNGVIYYEDDPSLTKEAKKRLQDAMNHWVSKTNITFQPKGSYPNYVKIKDGPGCSSAVGMRGIGEQTITLNKQCDLGAVIHEIGHTAGLFHEQSRHDRDSYVTIMWDQIIEDKKFNFDIPDSSISKDTIAYDYDSIMHYGAFAFAKGALPTIVPKESGVTIGQRNGLSQDDIAAIAAMYGSKMVTTRQAEKETLVTS